VAVSQLSPPIPSSNKLPEVDPPSHPCLPCPPRSGMRPSFCPRGGARFLASSHLVCWRVNSQLTPPCVDPSVFRPSQLPRVPLCKQPSGPKKFRFGRCACARSSSPSSGRTAFLQVRLPFSVRDAAMWPQLRLCAAPFTTPSAAARESRRRRAQRCDVGQSPLFCSGRFTALGNPILRIACCVVSPAARTHSVYPAFTASE
jgi:hypothetical protein